MARHSSAAAAWRRLDRPWREAFELAWTSYKAKTFPIGAVIVGADGKTIARGRNRVFESGGGRSGGSIRNTLVAHAEINALSQVPPDAIGPGASIYTTTEPCIQCAAAISMTGLEAVHFAVQDPFTGASWLLQGDNPAVPEGRFTLTGPMPGPMWAVASVVNLDFFRRLRGEDVVSQIRQVLPSLADAADEVARHDTLGELSRSGSRFPQVVDALWPAARRIVGEA